MESKHFVFVVRSDDPSPSGRGTAVDYFKAYKLASVDDIYIPWHGEYGQTVPIAGDVLWMQIEEDVIACVTIKHVMDDVMNDRIELWFDGTNIKTVEGLKNKGAKICGSVDPDCVADWSKHIAC